VAQTCIYFNRAITIVVCVVLIAAKVGCAADGNLILNGGFELGGSGVPASWILTDAGEDNTFTWVVDDRHSGNRSLKMTCLDPPEGGSSMSITSNEFEVSAYSRVEVSVWIKASNVISAGDASWYGLRVTITAYDEFGEKIEHRDIMNERGSFSWIRIRGGMMAPGLARTMNLSIKLTTSTGVVWVDDARAHVAQDIPNVDVTAVQKPILIPYPWKMDATNESFELEDVCVVTEFLNTNLRETMDSLLRSMGVDYEFLEPDDTDIWSYPTHILLGDSTNPLFNDEMTAKFPEDSWTDLGEQGYFITTTTRRSGRNYIYLGANTDAGLFYAIQTFRQLVTDHHVHLVDIFDRPTLDRRGIPMGLQWFEERRDEALQRLSELKFNLVWAQGSFLDDYLDTDNWRLDLTDAQRAILREFIELYQKNFFEVWIAIGPRGKNPPLQYSSAADVDTLVKKMHVLYSLGLRHFGLRFDDLQNVGEDRLLTIEDIKLFDDDIGDAQVYFISQVFNRLKAIHPDIEFAVIPMDYNQIGNFGDMTLASSRLQKFYTLPSDIGMYAVACYSEDVLAMTYLTGRSKIMIGSNLYVEGNGDLPEYVIPFLDFIDWENPVIRRSILAFTWLPKIPPNEDAALVSWSTAADFAWAPERYEPVASFERAAARYLTNR